MFVHSRFIINTFAHLTGLVIIINLIHPTKDLWSHQIVSLISKPKMQARVWNLCVNQGKCHMCVFDIKDCSYDKHLEFMLHKFGKLPYSYIFSPLSV